MTKKYPRNHFDDEVDELKEHLIHIKDTFVEHVADAADAAQKSEDKLIESVETHPLVSLGLSAAVGFLLGILVARK
jgi:ElaB/YqjD/DUF883 family membrane-anchored ribosome-binding protein